MLLFALIKGYPQLFVHVYAEPGTFHHSVMRVPSPTLSVPEVADAAGLETTKTILPGESNTGSGTTGSDTGVGGTGSGIVLVAGVMDRSNTGATGVGALSVAVFVFGTV